MGRSDHQIWRCGKDGLKISCLLTNPQVCLEVDELISISSGKIACNFTTKYRSALAFGTARILEESVRVDLMFTQMVSLTVDRESKR